MTEKKNTYTELIRLLKLEKEADYEYHKKLAEQLSLTEKKEQGLLWYPLQVVKTGFAIGERAFVILQRADGEKRPHMLRSGKLIKLFTQLPRVKQPEYNGIIQYVNKDKIKIILNTDTLPDWIALGNVGVELTFDERTYQEMEKAMKKLLTAKGDRLAELRSILIGKQEARFAPSKETIEIPALNPSQNKALNNIIAAQDIAIIHGPPGTGKTTTLVETIHILSKREQTILVTAPSNAAVDLLTLKLAEKGLRVARVGNISRVDEEILNHTLDIQIANHPESKHIKKVRIQAAECRKKAGRYKRTFGYEERTERRNLYKEAGELSAWAKQLEDRLVDQILGSAHVITATLIGSTARELTGRSFNTLVIDEAAQAMETACWVPIVKANRIVLAGDPFQLPPTIKSNDAARQGLGITLLERCLDFIPHISLLNIQYRMHEHIMGFSNQYFYQGQLNADETVRHHQLFEGDIAMEYIDTAGCGFDEKTEEKYKSRFNPDEYNILREHLLLLEQHLNTEEAPSIAIISPYRQQVIYMKEQIDTEEQLKALKLSVNTIDAFQGQERDII